MAKKRVKLIINPNADMGNAWRHGADLRPIMEEFGGADWAGTVYPTHATELTRLAADDGYEQISEAPPPSERYRQFLGLDYPRKVVTVEPVMDFEVDDFAEWLASIQPEYVWLGYNSRPRQVQLPEPSPEKFRQLVSALSAAGVQIKFKETRGIRLPGAI